MKRLSLVVSVLASYEAVRRQLLHLGRILPADCELILVDDGSDPSLAEVCAAVVKPFAFTLLFSHDRRPWTQPRGRNLGAAHAHADKLVFFDIDHILTTDVLDRCLAYQGDKLHWERRTGSLDATGELVIDDPASLTTIHINSFLIRKPLFDVLGGYDEKFCGRYGGDDVDFNRRYAELCRRGLARPEDVAGLGYVFPEPAQDRQGFFHRLPRQSETQFVTEAPQGTNS